MVKRVLVVAAVTLAALATTVPAAGAAPRAFGPEVTAVGGCSGSGGAVTAADGSVSGFAACAGFPGPPIRFFHRTAAGVVSPSENSGFAGNVLGVAQDATATYVLFHTSNTIAIGKRTTAGAYSSRVVDTYSGVSIPSGDVIARDGQWLGVWTKQVGPGGEFADNELFQAGTGQPVTRITSRSDLDDYEPALAYSSGVPVLVWTRQQAPYVPGPSDVWVAKYVGGAWQSRVFASAGTFNYSPDIATGGGRTYVSWGRDGTAVVAGNDSGAFVSHAFAVRGYGPDVAVSTTAGAVDHVFVTWSAGDRVFFAETASAGAVTGWQGAYLTDSATGPSVPLAVGGHGGRATVTYTRNGSVRLRTQT